MTARKPALVNNLDVTPTTLVERELRIALAMKGGVSLAVWIGGAMAELDLLRRAMTVEADHGPEDPPEGFGRVEWVRALQYRNRVRALGFTSVRIDVLAGASAGGLNAVVYGFAQSIGVNLDWLLDVWKSRGDIMKLFGEQWSPGQPFRTEAVLDADSNFYRPLRDALDAQRAGTRHERLRTDYLTVDLSATLQAGEPLQELTPPQGRAPIPDLRPRTAHFRFRLTPAAPGPFTHFPTAPAAGDGPAQTQNAERRGARQPNPPTENEARVRQLAYAARSTSSFPGAFEPAANYSWIGTDPPPSARRTDPRPWNLADVFSEVGTDPTTPFDIMDGGVFDNIPIARALHAIDDAPAGAATKRILIYLDPSPESSPPPAPTTPEFDDSGSRRLRARFLRSVARVIRYKMTTESSWDDLRELDELRVAQAERHARRVQFLRTLPLNLIVAGGGAPAVPAGYLGFRSRGDAERLTELLVNPGVGFLRALVPSPPVRAALATDQAAAFSRLLQDALQETLVPGDPAAARVRMKDVGALAEAAGFFISWVQREQDRRRGQPRTESSSRLESAKGRLYLVRSWALYHRQRSERAAVVALAGSTPDPDLGLTQAARIAADLLWPGRVVTGPAPVFTSDEGFWTALGDWESGLAGTHDPAEMGWKELHRIVVGALQAAGESETFPTLTYLQHLVARANIALGSLESTAVPEYYTITADETPFGWTPDSWSPEGTSSYPWVRSYGMARQLDEHARRLARQEPALTGRPSTINTGSKLAGSELFNFGGFLAEEWRIDDFEWGRADACSGLLRILDELYRTVLPPGTSPGDTPGPPLTAAATPVADSPPLIADPVLAEPPGNRPGRLKDLSPARRYAITARVGLALQRALWPQTPDPTDTHPGATAAAWLGTAAAIAVRMALRPLLVLVPLVTAPAALAGSVLAACVAYHVAAPSGPAEDRATLLLVAVMTVTALLLGRLASLHKQRRIWNSLREQAGALAPPGETANADHLCRTALGRATWWLIGWWVGVVILALGAALWWDRLASLGHDLADNATGFEIMVTLTGLIVLISMAGRVRAQDLVSRPGRVGTRARWPRFTVSLATVALWLAPGAGLVALIAFGVAAPVTTALAVAVTVWAVHHAWSDRLWQAGAAILSFVSALGLQLWHPAPLVDALVDRDGHAWAHALVSVAVPLSLPIILLVTMLIARPVTKRLGPAGTALCTMVPVVLAMGTIRELAAIWPWLGSVPLALTMGCAAAAITTLVTPFRDAAEIPAG